MENQNNISREAPLVYSYAVTINVSPKKRIQQIVYGNVSNLKQRVILENITSTCLHNACLSAKNFEYIFENTELGHAHMHAELTCTHEQMLEFQNEIHKKLGMPSLQPHIVCLIKPISSERGWFLYMNKAQPKSPKSPDYPLFSLFIKHDPQVIY